jgi:hypothetical protein
MFLLAYGHALRASEIASLTLEDVRNGRINCARGKMSDHTVEELRESQNILLDEKMALAAWLRERDEGDGSVFLFTSRQGSRIVVAPGIDPGLIALRFRGGSDVVVDQNGDLLLNSEDVRFAKPVVYQNTDGTRKPVESQYVMTAENTIRFTVGDYDRSKPLVIDPVLLYSLPIAADQNVCR